MGYNVSLTSVRTEIVLKLNFQVRKLKCLLGPLLLIKRYFTGHFIQIKENIYLAFLKNVFGWVMGEDENLTNEFF